MLCLPTDLIPVYIAIIRLVLEYYAPVWHTSTPAFLSDDLERVPKRAFRILYEALSLAGCQSLSERRSKLCIKTFNKICQPHSRLHNLVPGTRVNAKEDLLRNGHFLTLPKCQTERFERSFILAML